MVQNLHYSKGCVELLEKKKFAIVLLNLEYETFIVYIVSFSFIFPTNADIYLSYRFLITTETYTKIWAKYANFANIFFLNLAFELLKYIKINDYVIMLVDSQ